jgi:hypothetical protein
VRRKGIHGFGRKVRRKETSKKANTWGEGKSKKDLEEIIQWYGLN